jgi:hypothetical protein
VSRRYLGLRGLRPRLADAVILKCRRYHRENPLGAENPSKDEISARVRLRSSM